MTINCKGDLIDLSIPRIMGIVNCTPDSFYKSSRFVHEVPLMQQIEKMLKEGATFIDIGAYSSRPQADFVSLETEKKRLLPMISAIVKQFPEVLLSVDTFRAEIAKESIAAGAALINDISAGNLDSNMLQTISQLKVPYLMMHMRGTPQTMKNLNRYDNLITDINFFFSKKIAEAQALGICDLMIDPGFGFAKDSNQNYTMLSKLSVFKIHNVPIVVGVSRKSMIYQLLDSSPQQALNGTSCLHTIALLGAASMLRVHDVKEAKECIQLTQKMIEIEMPKFAHTLLDGF